MRRYVLWLFCVCPLAAAQEAQQSGGQSSNVYVSRTLAEQYNDAAFEEALRKSVPLTPAEIAKVKRYSDDVSHVTAKRLGPPVAPVISSEIVDLSPGARIPLIRLATNVFSTILINDITGAPWPIEKDSISGKKVGGGEDGQGATGSMFYVEQLGPNSLTISSQVPYAEGNIAVKLVDLDTPLVLTVTQGRNLEVDYRRDLHIQRLGPNGKHSTSAETVPDHDKALYAFLDGIPPQGAIEKDVDGHRHTRAWLYQDALYVRTTATLHSPAWLASTRSSDGTNVYKLDPAPLLLFSAGGKLDELSVGL